MANQIFRFGFQFIYVLICCGFLAPFSSWAQSIVPPLQNPSATNSQQNPFLFSLPGHLEWLKTQTGATSFCYIEQINDIDLTGNPLFNIGSSVSPLRMNYQGNGFQIKNINYTPGQNANHQIAFFSYLKDSQIDNLIISDPDISTGQRASGFAAWAVNCQLTNCQVLGGTVKGEIQVSGFVSEAQQCTFTNCASNTDLIVTAWGAAGIAFNCVGTIIDMCSVYGTISELGPCQTQKYNQRGIGGIAGRLDANSSIVNSFCHASVSWLSSCQSMWFAGIACDKHSSAVVQNSYFSGTITAASSAARTKYAISGTSNPTSVCLYLQQVGLTTTQTNATSISDFTSASLFPTNWLVNGNWVITSGINNGEPYQAASVYVSSNTNSSTNLTIPANTTFTVNPGVVLEVNTLFNYGNIILKASALGYSQLKFTTLGSLTNSVTQEQYLEIGSHLISSPTANGLSSTSGDNSQLYAFNALLGGWYPKGTQISSTGIGFAAMIDGVNIPFMIGSNAFSVSGTANTSNTWTISNATLTTSTGSGAGWNLLGNPYTCGLDFSNVYSNNSSLIENAYYVWDAAAGGGAGGYVYYSGGGLSSPIIPPMQAFWVQAKTSQSGTITTTMSTDGTVASSPTYYKTRPDNLVLRAALLGDTLISDRMWVAHVSGTTSSFDGAYDAWKMTNGPLMPNIYSYVDAEGIAINALDLNGNQIIPVGFDYVDVGTKFRITLNQVTNGQVYQVYLEDKALLQFHDLNQGEYPFTHQVWTQEEPRFALHVSQSTVGAEESDASPTSLVIYQDGARLMVHWYEPDQANYRLVTLDGKELSKGAIQSGLQSLDAPEVSGVYILELAHPHGVERQKFLVTY